MNNLLLRRTLAIFLPVAAVLTVACGLVYAAGEQEYRSSADDPQLQIAVDAASRLDAGTSPAVVAAGPTVDLSRSMATHITVYDRHHTVLASNARLDGMTPTVPPGALDTARSHGRNLITWQPRAGVRVAAVIASWQGGSVLVGRSLAPTEGREIDLEGIVAAFWIAGLLFTALCALVAARLLLPGGITTVASPTHVEVQT